MRKLVAFAPRSIFTFMIVMVGVLSSIAADAGYLVLVPLAAAAFHRMGRHPLAGATPIRCSRPTASATAR